MAQVTLEKLDRDIQDMKIVLHRLAHIMEEDFELSENTKKELREARSESLSGYIDHKEVFKEFA